jgi:replicative DNA helicase
VLIFSMEMPDEEIMTRLVANTASVPVGVLTSGTASDYQRGLVHRAVADLRKKQLLINDRAAINASQIVSQVDRAIQQAGELPALVVVDYLQLISQPDAKRREDQALGDITRALKICAKDKNVPVLLLSQLNREVEGRSSTAPRLADLRGSGCIEQDADCVLFLHRQNKPDAGEVDNTAELLIAKHRAGPLGQIPMAFHGQYQRYEVVTRETSYTGQQAPRQGRQL